MKDATRQLTIDMIRTERSRRVAPADRALLDIREHFARNGALGHGRYPLLLDEGSAAEYEERAHQWLVIARRIVSELALPWNAALAQEVRHLIELELNADWQEIFTRLERMAKSSRGLRMDRLDAAKNRARKHLEQELSLLVLKQDRSRLPLLERLTADRYRAVAQAWRKANQLLENQSQDPANAAKEAVGAVEALARILLGNRSATLGDAIKALRAAGRVDPPMLKGIEELWGWASGEPGVRHGALEGPLQIAEVRYCLKLAEAALDLLLALDAA